VLLRDLVGWLEVGETQVKQDILDFGFFQTGKGKGNATAVLLRRDRDTGPGFLDARNAQGTECSTSNFLRLFVIVIRCIEYYTTYLTV